MREIIFKQIGDMKWSINIDHEGVQWVTMEFAKEGFKFTTSEILIHGLSKELMRRRKA